MRRRKRLTIALIVSGCALATTAYGDSSRVTFKQEPTAGAEKAIAQLLETFASKWPNSPGTLSELYAPDAEMHFLAGPSQEPRTVKGREQIQRVLSSRPAGLSFESVQLQDVVIKVDGDTAEATGHWTAVGNRRVGGTAVSGGSWGGPRLIRITQEDDRTWGLRREADGWRIHRQASRNGKSTRQ